MVGIVVVSHSWKLAEGVRELADQMVQGQVPLAIAGGIDDPEHPIGTDPLAVQAAIEAVYSDDGVLVLMDLGSALLSAEMALEFLRPEQRANVVLAAAPLVEGALAAAVQASVGGSLAQVLAEAQGALAVKVSQLAPPDGPPPDVDEAPAAGAAETAVLPVNNRLGLHARPAARFVATANRFDAAITIAREGRAAAVNAKSINQVATLGVRQGDWITVTAVGPDAAEALAALQALAADNYGDPPDGETEPAAPPAEATPPPADLAENVLAGIPGSPGIAIGPAAVYRPRRPAVERRTGADPAAEWARLQTAVDAARTEIVALGQEATRRLGAAEAAIFDAHALFLQDPALLDDARDRLVEAGINAEAAWQAAIEAQAEQYRALDDAYMQARAADVLDVGERVLAQLMGVERPSLDLAEPAILVAPDLNPSDTAQLDPALVLGIAVERGGATSHSTILARALGIPAVVGVGPELQRVADGQPLAVDGGAGRVWLAPGGEALATLTAQQAAWQAQQAAAQAASRQPAVTQDGHRVEVAANIGGPHDAAVALAYGAEGVGLFRTEFLFMGRESAPDEAEQLAAYAQAATVMGDRPLIIRTLDVGGDKPLSYLDQEAEENPFLGWRGIRFCLDRPQIFRPQLRAILRASVDEAGRRRNVKVMFPMVGTLAEFRAAKAMVVEVQAELEAEGAPFDESMEIGLMIEVPSAAAVADQLAAEADFFSIGTNDLTQYVMAADRGNSRVAGLVDALQPAVLRLIRQTVEAAHAAGIWVGICGELAGNPLAAPLLVGLGLDELSMSAPAIPAVKASIRRLTLADAQAVATAVLDLGSAAEVRAYLEGVAA